MLKEEIGDTAYGINRGIFKIDLAVTIEIKSISSYAAGHELRVSYGSGIWTVEIHWIRTVFSGQQKKIFQFPTKKRFPDRLIGRLRIIESQCGKRIDCPEIAGMFPYTDSMPRMPTNDMGRHADFFSGPV